MKRRVTSTSTLRLVKTTQGEINHVEKKKLYSRNKNKRVGGAPQWGRPNDDIFIFYIANPEIPESSLMLEKIGIHDSR